eukprot:ctg_1573.g514
MAGAEGAERHSHSKNAYKILRAYLVGRLADAGASAAEAVAVDGTLDEDGKPLVDFHKPLLHQVGMLASVCAPDVGVAHQVPVVRAAAGVAAGDGGRFRVCVRGARLRLLGHLFAVCRRRLRVLDAFRVRPASVRVPRRDPHLLGQHRTFSHSRSPPPGAAGLRAAGVSAGAGGVGVAACVGGSTAAVGVRGRPLFYVRVRCRLPQLRHDPLSDPLHSAAVWLSARSEAAPHAASFSHAQRQLWHQQPRTRHTVWHSGS